MNSEELDQTLRQLETIARTFPVDSPEADAIKVAAEALFFAHSAEMSDRYVKFVMSANKDLTPAQVLHLRAIGIDPDSDEEGEPTAVAT